VVIFEPLRSARGFLKCSRVDSKGQNKEKIKISKELIDFL
jgi:hypothetical protein